MANRREVKKDIQFIIHDFIDECCAFIINNPGEKEKEINKNIDEAVELYDDLMHRVNNHSHLKGKEVNAHFKEIYKDLEEKSIALTKKFNKNMAS